MSANISIILHVGTVEQAIEAFQKIQAAGIVPTVTPRLRDANESAKTKERIERLKAIYEEETGVRFKIKKEQKLLIETGQITFEDLLCSLLPAEKVAEVLAEFPRDEEEEGEEKKEVKPDTGGDVY